MTFQDAIQDKSRLPTESARRGDFVESRIWYRRVGRTLDSVCCIKIEGQPAGTGFLVGPKSVLTNYHVLQHVLRADGVLTKPVICSFDYTKRATGAVTEGLDVRVEKCVDFSPYGQMEATEHPFTPPLPTDDELDYALITLEKSVGDGVTNSGQKRGWIPIPVSPSTPVKDEIVVIVQHPLGGAQVFDERPAIGPRLGGRRFGYETRTEPGSSGSPCLTKDYVLVGLHHLGDANWGNAKFAQGVPIELIRRHLVDRGHAALIPSLDEADEATDAGVMGVFLCLITRNDEAKRKIVTMRSVIDQVSQGRDRLRGFKTFHDLLQTIQGHLPLIESFLDASNAVASAESVKAVARIIEKMWASQKDELRQLRRGVTGSIFDWTEEFGAAVDSLCDLDPASDFDPHGALEAIKTQVRLQPPLLNQGIIYTLSEIPIDELVAAFRNIAGSFAGGTGTYLEAGPTALQDIWNALRDCANQHNRWQDLDNDLCRLDELRGDVAQETSRRTFSGYWKVAWRKCCALCDADAEADWSNILRAEGENVQAAISSADWGAVSPAFGKFRSEMEKRFNFVDKLLLAYCVKLVDASDPLALLLKELK